MALASACRAASPSRTSEGSISGTTLAPGAPSTALLTGKRGCFLLRELHSGRTVLEKGGLCSKRVYACSTFKVPLALMGFDSGLLRDADTSFPWDGTRYPIESWNKDQTARSWLAESVVWYSQRLTPQLGLKRIQDYLKDFRYGNRDFSGGLSKAWLSSSLKISPREQTEFLRRLRLGELKVSEGAALETLDLLPVELEDGAVRLTGKTGSGFSWEDPKSRKARPYRVGWYVGYLRKDFKDYVFAAVFKEPTEKGKRTFGGAEARRLSRALMGLP